MNKGIESLCLKFCFSNSYIFATKCRRPSIFQIIHSVRSTLWNILSLKYQSFSSSGFKDEGIRKIEFVAKTQFRLKKSLTTSLEFCSFSLNVNQYDFYLDKLFLRIMYLFLKLYLNRKMNTWWTIRRRYNSF